MSFPAPDLAGFAAAQDWLIDTLGRPVTFCIPIAPVWPPDTVLRDDGRPMDPQVQPQSGGGYTPVVKTVTLVIERMTSDGDAKSEAAGMFSGADAIVKLKSTDHADVANATRIVIESGERFAITSWKPHPFGPDRWMFGYCEAL